MRNKVGDFFDGLAFFFLAAEIFLFTWGASGTRADFLMPMFWAAFAAFSCSLFGRISLEGKAMWACPLFWAGMGFSIMGLLQSFNLSGEYEQYQAYSAFRPFDYICALPSSVAAPFDAGNAQSALVKILSAFFIACTSFMLFQRALFARCALAVFSVNSAAMGLFALIQPFINMPNMYFIVYSDVDFYGSFFLTNAAGAFLNLGVAASLSAAYIWFKRGSTAFAILFCACALLCAAASCMSGSVGAIFSLLVFIGAIILCVAFGKFGVRAGAIVSGMLLALSALSAALFLSAGNIASLENSVSSSLLSRTGIYKQTLAFDGANAIWGRGGNSYRYLVRPKIVAGQEKSGAKSFKAPVHPHSDVLSYYFEYGAAGLFLIALCALWWAHALFSKRGKLSFANYCAGAGVAVCALHSCFDMNLSIPSVMMAFAMMALFSVSPQEESAHA